MSAFSTSKGRCACVRCCITIAQAAVQSIGSLLAAVPSEDGSRFPLHNVHFESAGRHGRLPLWTSVLLPLSCLPSFHSLSRFCADSRGDGRAQFRQECAPSLSRLWFVRSNPSLV